MPAYQRLIQSERSLLALRALAQIDEIKRNVWVTLNRDQRLAALREVNRVYLAAYGMGPTTIRFELIPQDGKTILTGYFERNAGAMTIDDRLVMPALMKPEVAVVHMVNTVVHESRHYAQWRAVRYPKAFPSFFQAAEWKRDFSTPASPTSDYKAYATRPLESDAFLTANEACAFLYPDAKYFDK